MTNNHTIMTANSIHSITMHSKTVSLSHKAIMDLSIGHLDWDSTSESDDDEDDSCCDFFETLHETSTLTPEDDLEKSVEDSFNGSFRWTDRTKISDEVPELIRRRQSVDQVDDESSESDSDDYSYTSDEDSVASFSEEDDDYEPEKPKSFTKLGGRISLLVNSPTNSPRSTLAEFLDSQRMTTTTRALKSALDDTNNQVTGFIDDLSLDDTIYTIEDEMQFMCVTMENTTI